MLFVDTETYSTVPIQNGTYAYAASVEVMLITWAEDDGPVEHLDLTRGDDINIFKAAIERHDVIVAHNAMFDRSVLRLGNLGIDIPIEKWRCGMVKALAHGFPGSLDKLCEIMGVPQEEAKLKNGRALVMKFCKPLPKSSKTRRATRHTHPAEWADFVDYACADITAMRAVWKRLPSWNYGPAEVALWHLDQRMNDRGVFLDLELVDAAIRATAEAKSDLNCDISMATGGSVGAASQRDVLLEWIAQEYGIFMEDLKGSTVDKFLEKEDIEPGLREVLRIRAQVSQVSTAKYQAFKKGANSDGRLRGMIQFDGAARTRRDAGRTVQLQNLPSRGLLSESDIAIGIEALKNGSEAYLFDNVMLLLTSTLRSVICAHPGKKLLISDLSNIEGRGLAWAAGEEWKLQAYRDFDNGIGDDLYNLAYAKSFGISPKEVTKPQRQIGKVMELGLGYAGGISAFMTFALGYGIDLEAIANAAWDNIAPERLSEAGGFVTWAQGKGRSWPMSNKAATVCEAFKSAWREAHAMVVQLWSDMDIGFMSAANHPGETFRFGKFAFRRDGAYLRIALPSGRYLVYPQPEVGEKGQLSHMGVNQFTRKWERVKTYGGKLTENAVQSLARDFMFDNLHLIEKAGMDLLLRVHDEVVVEVPDVRDYTAAQLSAILATLPPWGEGMPLAAAGFESYRYRK